MRNESTIRYKRRILADCCVFHINFLLFFFPRYVKEPDRFSNFHGGMSKLSEEDQRRNSGFKGGRRDAIVMHYRSCSSTAASVSLYVVCCYGTQANSCPSSIRIEMTVIDGNFQASLLQTHL